MERGQTAPPANGLLCAGSFLLLLQLPGSPVGPGARPSWGLAEMTESARNESQLLFLLLKWGKYKNRWWQRDLAAAGGSWERVGGWKEEEYVEKKKRKNNTTQKKQLKKQFSFFPSFFFFLLGLSAFPFHIQHSKNMKCISASTQAPVRVENHLLCCCSCWGGRILSPLKGEISNGRSDREQKQPVSLSCIVTHRWVTDRWQLCVWAFPLP